MYDPMQLRRSSNVKVPEATLPSNSKKQRHLGGKSWASSDLVVEPVSKKGKVDLARRTSICHDACSKNLHYEINPAHVIHRVNVIILALELEEVKSSRLPKGDIELADWDLSLRCLNRAA
ncbi:hypothetical protein RHGRI_033673 [Rhododendron griersonianum]|uniref:Uncharacterized protein n=1 Tax=Rhododendron griersonianum TaxID=479676 RepID=A0AAV6HXP2_9ERIC|nr:hypothetical protein RHGRI_033673 [Rhododendron griersonianum]